MRFRHSWNKLERGPSVWSINSTVDNINGFTFGSINKKTESMDRFLFSWFSGVIQVCSPRMKGTSFNDCMDVRLPNTFYPFGNDFLLCICRFVGTNKIFLSHVHYRQNRFNRRSDCSAVQNFDRYVRTFELLSLVAFFRNLVRMTKKQFKLDF